jgi:hypothetical protein
MTPVTALSTVSVAGVAARWRLTPWDADGLGLPATAELVELDDGPASAQAVVLAALDDDLGARDVALVTTRVAAERTATLAALTAAGWRAVETSHALTLDLAGWSPPPSLRRAVAVEPATAADALALAELAATAFDYSRFHEDPRIHPARARGRYRRWIVDSLSNGDEVWVHRRAEQVAALMSFRRVAPTQVELRLGGVAVGLGPLASMFWVGVLRGLAAQGVAAIATRVSAANAGALRLHDALGFARGPIAIGATKLYAPSLVAAPPPRTAVRT